MPKVRKVDLDKIKTGDIVFTSSQFPMGWITKRVTKSVVTHVGVVVKINGVPLIFEMVGDLKRNDNDLETNEFSKYLKPWRFWETIYSVKRSDVFKDKPTVRAFTTEMINTAFKKTGYDFRELISFISKKKDKYPNRLICSGLVYIKTEKFGVPWRDYGEKGFAPSPAELYEDPCLKEVDGWKVK